MNTINPDLYTVDNLLKERFDENKVPEIKEKYSNHAIVMLQALNTCLNENNANFRNKKNFESYRDELDGKILQGIRIINLLEELETWTVNYSNEKHEDIVRNEKKKVDNRVQLLETQRKKIKNFLDTVEQSLPKFVQDRIKYNNEIEKVIKIL